MEIALQGRAPRGWDHRLCGFILAVLLSFEIPRSTAKLSITLVPASPIVGGDVVLNVSFTETIIHVIWYRAKEDAIHKSNWIMTYNPGAYNPLNYGVRYSSRETVLRNGALQITRLMAGDMGDYTVQMASSSGLQKATVHLHVSDRPMNPPRPASTIKPVSIRRPHKPPTPVRRSTKLSVSHSTSSGDPSEDNRSSGVISAASVGAIVGVVSGVGSAAVASFLLYKKLHNTRDREGRTPPNPPPRQCTLTDRISVKSDGYVGPREIRPHACPKEALLPSLYTKEPSSSLTSEHVYMEIEH